MALHPQAQAVLDQMVALGEPPLEEDTPAAARARRAARIRPATELIHHRRDLDAAGVPARLYRPSDEVGLGLLVYFHGGGWVLGSVDGHDDVCRALANRSGAAVLSVDYRLAPEHPFPAALEDALGALRWAHQHATELGADPHRLAIGGDSAGANLAAVVAQLAPVPLRFQLLVYPVTDARGGTPLTSSTPTATTSRRRPWGGSWPTTCPADPAPPTIRGCRRSSPATPRCGRRHRRW